MNHSIGFVFIHGAGLDSFIWDRLIDSLSAPCLAVRFPKRQYPAKETEVLSLQEYINDLSRQIEVFEAREFILVTHSIGTCLGLPSTSMFCSRLKGFVSIAGSVPPSGQSFLKTLSFSQRILMPLLLKAFGTRPPNRTIEKELCHDLDEAITAQILQTFTPESRKIYTDPILYSIPECRRMYIQTTEDRSIPASLQNQMAQELKAHQTVKVPGGHLAMLSQVKALSTILADWLEDIKRTT